MKILVTGYKGLIGSRIYRELSNRGYNVLGYDKQENKSALIPKVDAIIHCASHCIIRDVIENPDLAFENVASHFNIYEMARQMGCKKVVFFSSSRVTHSQKNPYTASKVFGEELAEAYRQCYGIESIIIRPETVWAIDDMHDRVIPAWIRAAMKNEDIIVYGNESKELPPIHVDSFVDIFLHIFKEFLNNNIIKTIWYISGKPWHADELIKIIIEQTKSNSKVIYKDAELTQPQSCNRADVVVDDFKDKLKYELQCWKR